jgi:hypothetical protein
MGRSKRTSHLHSNAAKAIHKQINTNERSYTRNENIDSNVDQKPPRPVRIKERTPLIKINDELITNKLP